MLNIDVVLRKIRILIVTFYVLQSISFEVNFHIMKNLHLHTEIKKDLFEKEDFKT